MSSPELHVAIAAELRRLGLRNGPSGLAAASLGAMPEFLTRLRSLPIGATWNDVFSDPGPPAPAPVPETPALPYRPLGRWDHPEGPAEPVFHLIHTNGDEEWLTDLLITAATEGVPLHGAGVMDQKAAPRFGSEHGFVVLRRGLSEGQVNRVWEWLRHQPDIIVESRCR